MAGTTLIDYAVSKLSGALIGLISWNTDEVKASSITDWALNGILGTNIGRIFADVKVSETHKMQSVITDQTLEDGSSVHEHVIPQPAQVTLQIEETNNTLGSRFSKGFFGPQQTFDKLVELWRNAVPLTITTQHKQYKNMVITNMPILHRAPYRNALQITIDLKQLEFTSLQTFSFKALTDGLNKAASSALNGGGQKLQNWLGG